MEDAVKQLPTEQARCLKVFVQINKNRKKEQNVCLHLEIFLSQFFFYSHCIQRLNFATYYWQQS